MRPFARVAIGLSIFSAVRVFVLIGLISMVVPTPLNRSCSSVGSSLAIVRSVHMKTLVATDHALVLRAVHFRSAMDLLAITCSSTFRVLVNSSMMTSSTENDTRTT
jgi:hypothetical protein